MTEGEPMEHSDELLLPHGDIDFCCELDDGPPTPPLEAYAGEIFQLRRGDEWRSPVRPSEEPPEYPTLGFLGPLDVASINPTKFVYGRFFARGYTSLTVASPKVGISMLGLAETVDMASGGQVFGCRFDPLRALYFNAEDSLDTLKARVAAICSHFEINLVDVAETLAIESGVDWPDLFLMKQQGADVVLNAPAFGHLEERIQAHRFDLVQFDPLQDMSRASESNEAFRALGLRLRPLASDTGIAVGLTHHLRKIAPGVTPSIDDARGGSALRGTCRFNRVLVGMSANEAEKAGVEDYRLFFCIGEIESNLAPPSADVNRWFRKLSVRIVNGESVGVVAPWTWPDSFSGITSEMAALARDEAARLPPEERRENVKAKAWFGHMVARICDLKDHPDDSAADRKRKKSRVKEILRAWVHNGVLEVVSYRDPKGKRDVPYYAPGPNDPRVVG